MYKPNFKTDHKSLPVLSRNKIDEIAECFLWDYQPSVFRSPAAIDIDGFLEDYLGAVPDYQYLSNNMIYLGMTVFLGILRRASMRGKKLPEVLKKALERQAGDLLAEIEPMP